MKAARAATRQDRGAKPAVHLTTVPERAPDDAERLAAEIAGGKVVNVPFDENDFGSELVAILSEGLYTDPRDCIRELLQNALDADSVEAWIKFSGRDISIKDHGRGMDLPGLLDLKRIAKSPKMGTRAIGFRGIGAYSAFAVCDRMLVATQTSHSDVRYTMTFDFARMREILEHHRTESGRNQASAVAMLHDCVTLTESEVDPLEHGKTTVTLENVHAEKYREIHDLEQLEIYLVKNLPIAFEPSESAEKITRELSSLVPGYRTIRVHLEDPLQKLSREVLRRLPATVGDPIFLHAKSKDRLEAIIWACLGDKNKGTRRLKDGGLVFKVHGFAIGDRENVRPLFDKEQAYLWYFGEVYVIDEEVKPNSARNDFEHGPARDRLRESVRPELKKLGRIAADRWALSRAEEIFDKTAPEVDALGASVKADRAKKFVSHHYAEIQRLRAVLKKQRLPKLPEAEPLRVKAESLASLLDTIEKMLPVQVPHDQRSGGNDGGSNGRSQERTPAETRNEGDGARNEHARADESHHGGEGQSRSNIEEICATAGLRLTAKQQQIIRIVQSALDESVPPGTAPRSAFDDAVARHAKAAR